MRDRRLADYRRVVEECKAKSPANTHPIDTLHFASDSTRAKSQDFKISSAPRPRPPGQAVPRLVDVADKLGRTPAYLAADNGHVECLQVLLLHVRPEPFPKPSAERAGDADQGVLPVLRLCLRPVFAAVFAAACAAVCGFGAVWHVCVASPFGPEPRRSECLKETSGQHRTACRPNRAMLWDGGYGKTVLCRRPTSKRTRRLSRRS